MFVNISGCSGACLVCIVFHIYFLLCRFFDKEFTLYSTHTNIPISHIGYTYKHSLSLSLSLSKHTPTHPPSCIYKHIKATNAHTSCQEYTIDTHNEYELSYQDGP